MTQIATRTWTEVRPQRRRSAIPEGLWLRCPSCGQMIYRRQMEANLHVCPECASNLVYPVDWKDVSEIEWEVALRCPECEWNHVGVYQQEALDRFDEILDLGTDELLDDLKLLAKTNMESDVNRFVHALQNDAVWPMDF